MVCVGFNSAQLVLGHTLDAQKRAVTQGMRSIETIVKKVLNYSSSTVMMRYI